MIDNGWLPLVDHHRMGLLRNKNRSAVLRFGTRRSNRAFQRCIYCAAYFVSIPALKMLLLDASVCESWIRIRLAPHFSDGPWCLAVTRQLKPPKSYFGDENSTKKLSPFVIVSANGSDPLEPSDTTHFLTFLAVVW